jgi:hypothetical protein
MENKVYTLYLFKRATFGVPHEEKLEVSSALFDAKGGKQERPGLACKMGFIFPETHIYRRVPHPGRHLWFLKSFDHSALPSFSKFK